MINNRIQLIRFSDQLVQKMDQLKIILALVLLFAFSACGDAMERQSAPSPTTVAEPTTVTAVTSPVITEPITTLPPILPERELSPRYAQITGRITSIHGLLDDDGAFHEHVMWAHVNIEDEYGTAITLVATPDTVVPFGNLAVGEMVTGFLLANKPTLSYDPLMYGVSVLVPGMPSGLGVYVHYIDSRYETRTGAAGNVFQAQLPLGVPEVGQPFTTTSRRTFVTTENTIITSTFPELFSPPNAGLVVVYDTHDQVLEGFLFIENFYHWPDCGRYWCEFEFHMPQMFSLADFEVVDMPLFLHQEPFYLPTPPILHYDGVTIMVPFAPLANELWLPMFYIGCDGPWFGPVGGGSGETAMIRLGSSHASGTGFSMSFGTPAMLVDGIMYVPLFGFFAAANPWPKSDAFIYNDEIHIVYRGWSILQYHSWPIWWHDDMLPENAITIDISQLPIYVDRSRMNVPPAFLNENKTDIMLPLIPLAEALGFPITFLPCGAISFIDLAGRTISISRMNAEPATRCCTGELLWREHSLIRINDELYAPFWSFFRDILHVGGFVSYTRIELFITGAYSRWP